MMMLQELVSIFGLIYGQFAQETGKIPNDLLIDPAWFLLQKRMKSGYVVFQV